MLIVVFFMALAMLNESRTAEFTDLAKQLPREGFVLLARVLFIFVLGFVASAVAARGIQLFESCGPEDRRETHGARERARSHDRTPPSDPIEEA